MFVIPTLGGGGAERVAAILLRELSAMGINIVLVLFSKKFGYGIPENVTVRYIGINPCKGFVHTVVKFISIIINLKRIIKEERPFNVLSFMDYTNIVAILSNMISFQKSRVTISVRTSPSLHLYKYSTTFWNKITRILIKSLYNKANSIIAVSDFAKNDLIENFAIRPDKIMTIYNPIDTIKIKALAGENVSHPWFKDKIPVVLAVGRLSKEKGFDYLLKAFAIVSDKMDVRLLVMGEGEEEEHLKGLCQRFGINSKIYFAGFQENPYKYMKRSTIFVLSSLFEGFPNVLIEAMVCGLPVISTIYNPGYNEIIENEKNGLLVPVADEKALAEAMLRLLNNPEERRKYSAYAKERVKEFSLQEIAGQYKRALMDIKNE